MSWARYRVLSHGIVGPQLDGADAETESAPGDIVLFHEEDARALLALKMIEPYAGPLGSPESIH